MNITKAFSKLHDLEDALDANDILDYEDIEKCFMDLEGALYNLRDQEEMKDTKMEQKYNATVTFKQVENGWTANVNWASKPGSCFTNKGTVVVGKTLDDVFANVKAFLTPPVAVAVWG